MITVYHGGTEAIKTPLVRIGRKDLDFGPGFYNGYDPSTDYDCVEGGVANDRVVDTVEGFINGTIDEAHALSELSKHQPNNQICILNQELSDRCLKFVKVTEL